MNVALIGASGTIGSRILEELLSRGHRVKAIVRHAGKLNPHPNLTVAQADVLDPRNLEDLLQGLDAVISAYAPPLENPKLLLDATQGLLEALRRSGIRRFIMVGGAGSLEVAPGKRLVESDEFPPAWKPIALAHANALELLRPSDLDWTSVSPAAYIAPGEKTGHFRLGTDQLLTDAQGVSRISAEDFAIALVDELEQPKHIQRRFTVAY
ncbi:MAG TPA: NAD(P)-dependent oxidoreductase [Terriglobales bacterium]|jgi:putative NADH-flavin reductase